MIFNVNKMKIYDVAELRICTGKNIYNRSFRTRKKQDHYKERIIIIIIRYDLMNTHSEVIEKRKYNNM